MILADFHVHSTFSDGKLSIPELVDYFGSRGFGAIAITDHVGERETLTGKVSHFAANFVTEANFPIYLEIIKSEAERAWEQYRMRVIPGYELSKNSVLNSRSSHILALGVSEFMSADGDPLDLARAIRAQGALAIAAHPVFTGRFEKQTYHLWSRRDELAKEFDAWEVASGPILFNDVMHARLPKIANSDFHSYHHMTSWKTVLHTERHPEAILEAVRDQNVEFRFYEEACLNDFAYRDRVPLLGGLSAVGDLGRVAGT